MKKIDSKNDIIFPKPFYDTYDTDCKLYRAHIIDVASGYNGCIFGDWSFPPHYHNSLELFVPLGVRGEVVIDGASYSVADDQVLYMRPNAVHSLIIKKHSASKFIGLLINPSIFSRTYQAVTSDSGARFNRDFERLSVVHTRYASRLRELCLRLSLLSSRPAHPPQHPISVLSDMGVLNAILSLLLEEESTRGAAAEDNDWIRATLSLLHEYIGRPVSLGELALSRAVSKSHLCRKFKQCTGTTVLGYLNQIRVNHAMYLMARRGATVTVASIESGFDNVSYFIKIFRRVVGATPKQWATKMREGIRAG
jgi:AraC-like DNA-binding protein/mannose-6-phosphate isomerase-like protein (cupin superfamily)